MFIKHYTHTTRVHLFAIKNSCYKKILYTNNSIVTKVDFWNFQGLHLFKKTCYIMYVCVCVRKEEVCVRVRTRVCVNDRSKEQNCI